MNDIQGGWIKPQRKRTLQEIRRRLEELRVEYKALEKEAAALETDAKLEAIAMARNIMRAHELTLADVVSPSSTSTIAFPSKGLVEVDQAVLLQMRRDRLSFGEIGRQIGTTRQAARLRYLRAEQSQRQAASQTDVSGSFARLPPAIRRILTAQGLHTVAEVETAIDRGTISYVNGLGTARKKVLADWLVAERQAASGSSDADSKLSQP